MDYTMPRADNLPSFSVGTESTLCTHNSLGVKGCGEVGAIGSPPAVINAVVDALWGLGVRDMPMPANPQTVWKTIHAARPAAAAACPRPRPEAPDHLRNRFSHPLVRGRRSRGPAGGRNT